MKTTFKNIQTGELVSIYDFGKKGEVFVTTEKDDREKGSRFVVKYSGMLTEGRDENGKQFFTLNEGWEVVEGEHKPRQPKAKKEAAAAHVEKPHTKDEPTKDEQPEKVEVVTEDEPKVEAHPQPQVEDDTTNEQALIAALKNLRGGAVDITKVREIVADELAKLVATDAKKAAKVIEVAKKNNDKKNEVYCAKFQRIVAKVSRGNNVYLFGPAGSGKSHTAEQVAEALGLDFYGQTTIQFAHDVRGYGDAGGNYQDTPFYKAFAFGGLYFQDEYDRSNAEAAIVLNSALANGWYDFPIVGRVEAHPNFRFIAAGNTLMTGADEEYVTGQEIDASSRDRFAYFFEIDYSHEVELHIAHGNEQIVSFVEDVRQAIKQTGIKHVVSYRATAAMTDEVENENDLTACCDESVFKTLDVDARREIYERLNDKSNVWAKALKKLI